MNIYKTAITSRQNSVILHEFSCRILSYPLLPPFRRKSAWNYYWQAAERALYCIHISFI